MILPFVGNKGPGQIQIQIQIPKALNNSRMCLAYISNMSNETMKRQSEIHLNIGAEFSIIQKIPVSDINITFSYLSISQHNTQASINSELWRFRCFGHKILELIDRWPATVIILKVFFSQISIQWAD